MNKHDDYDILNDTSIADRIKSIEANQNVIQSIESQNIAYLIKNMDSIKKLIKIGEINNNIESVIKSIRKMSNNVVDIDPTDKVVQVLNKNKIYWKEECRSRQRTKDDLLTFGLTYLIFFVIYSFIAIPFMILCDYEVNVVETYAWAMFFIFLLTAFIFDDLKSVVDEDE